MKRRALSALALLALLVGVPGSLFVWSQLDPASNLSARTGLQTLLSPLTRGVGWGARTLSQGLEFVVTSAKLSRSNVLLEEWVSRLETENSFLREEILKFQRLDAAALLVPQRPLDLVPAGVIGYGTRRWDRSLLIDRGTRHGVESGDPVIHGGGLVGMVLAAGKWTSTVQLLDAPQSAVAVTVLPARARGVVEGDGTNKLILSLEQSHIPPRPGQRLITSGAGGSLYPRGIPVGTVEDLRVDALGRNIAGVRTAVDFRNIEEVLVLKARRRQTSTHVEREPDSGASHATPSSAGGAPRD